MSVATTQPGQHAYEAAIKRELSAGPDPAPVDLGTHIVMGPALYPRCELGHPLAILDGSHVRPWEMAAHGKR